MAAIKTISTNYLIRGVKVSVDPKIAERQIVKEWRAINDKKKEQQRKTHGFVDQLWRDWERTAIENLEQNRAWQRDTTLTVDQILDIIVAKNLVERRMRRPIQLAIREGFRRGHFNATGDFGDINFMERRVKESVETILGKTKGIGETTHRQLSARIRQAIADGADNDMIKGVVREYFRDSKASRAATITQTVTNTSYEQGQLIGFWKAGIKFKKWVSVRDGRVRESHWIADGQTQPLSGYFQVGLAELQFPSDPNGPAKEIINCRCSLLPQQNNED